jgi:glucoamylase
MLWPPLRLESKNLKTSVPRTVVTATLNRHGGVDYKNSQIDSAIILGVLHGHTDDGFFSFSDERVKQTLTRMIIEFKSTYAINQRAEIHGVAIGRYPEDKYAGAHFNGGNPWVLTTLATAQLYYEMAAQCTSQEKKQLMALADSFVERVRYHAYPDGSLSEQMDRYTGFMTSANNLTWNYAAVLTADKARRRGEKR